MTDMGNCQEHQLTEVSWIEEISSQELDTDVYGACTTNTFSLSDHWGNKGDWCTITHECMAWC